MCPVGCNKMTPAKKYELLDMEQDASDKPDPEAFLLQSKEQVKGMKVNSSGRKTGCRLMDVQGFGAAHEERALATTKLTRALVICVVFMVLEIVGGQFAGSLAVLADAAHMLSDVAGFAISLVALRASGWLATPQRTFGYFRLEVLGALVSVQIIWVMTGIILYEAFQRLYHGIHIVDGRLMFCVACVGLVLNFIMIFILGHNHDHNDAAHWHGHGHCHSLHKQNNDCDHLDDLEEGHSHKRKSGCCHGHYKHRHVRNSHVKEHEKQNQSLLVEVELDDSGLAGHRDHVCGHEHDEEKVGLAISHGGANGAIIASAEELPRVKNVSGEDADLAAGPETPGRELAFEDEIQGSKNSRERTHNINLRGAYLHALGDLIQNIGVLITGVVIWVKPQWQFIDLLCSVVFSIVVLMTTMKMLKDILWVLMESSSKDLDVEMLNNGLLQISGISAVLDLHVWALTPGTNLLSCHVEIKPGAVAREVLHDATEYCYNLHQIKHVTIQIEEAS